MTAPDLPARLRACVTLASAYKLMDEAASEIERLNADGPTEDFGVTKTDGTPVPVTMRRALQDSIHAADAEAFYANELKAEVERLAARLEEAEALLFDVRETLANVENTSEVDLSDACWCGVYDRIDAFLSGASHE